jgi:excinuclease ABC subunit C
MSDPSNSAIFDSAAFLKSAPTHPGVYRMFGEADEILYVGKAKNLKKRLASYFRTTGLTAKTELLVSQIRNIEVTITHTEGEALLLESNLIKEHRPRFNILLRDDKSYPYIYVSSHHAFPRMVVYRGARNVPGRFLGPYPNASAVHETLHVIHKLFRIRQCEDSYFSHRSRPCLQYQIKRCTAPCVGYIDEASYRHDIERALMFLEGKNTQLIEDLVQQMEQSSTALEFEKAAEYRDRIRVLQKVLEKQYVSGDSRDVDILACVSQGGQACVQVFVIRDGRNLGNRGFFPQLPEALDEADVLAAFLPQYYLQHEAPAEILLSHTPTDHELIESVLSERAGRKIKLATNVRGDRARWLSMAQHNAQSALTTRLNSRASVVQRFEALQQILELDELPQRLECFDISHTRGEATVASCVVFTLEGPFKQDYRRFNIEGIEPGDDYAAMRQALQRRYTRLKKGESPLPDILFIDGGKGQLRQAVEVLDQLDIDSVMLIGVAKGEGRKAGLEKLVFSDGREDVYLPEDSVAFHLILNIRDEAHRFAVSGHRKQRDKARQQSTLEKIPGLGPKRRHALIQHFGGIQGVKAAGVDDLVKVPGISRNMAQIIYDVLRSE